MSRNALKRHFAMDDTLSRLDGYRPMRFSSPIGSSMHDFFISTLRAINTLIRPPENEIKAGEEAAKKAAEEATKNQAHTLTSADSSQAKSVDSAAMDPVSSSAKFEVSTKAPIGVAAAHDSEKAHALQAEQAEQTRNQPTAHVQGQ